MKRALATALSVAAVLVLPASASAAIKITFKNWKVTTKNGKQHSVSPEGTFRRCGRKVVKLTAVFDYSGATPGKSYKQIWSLDGSDLITQSASWKDTADRVHASLFRNDGKALDDGKYKLRLRQSGNGIGSSYIKVRPGSNC